nr:two-component sensor kinase [Proteomonas sp. NEIS-1375]
MFSRTDNTILSNNSLSIGYILLDVSFTIVLINSKATSLVVHSDKNLVGSNLLLHMSPLFRSLFLYTLVDLSTQDGYTKWIQSEDVRFRISRPSSDAYVLSIEPSNVQKQTTQKFDLTPNITGVSHELRAPLFNIQSFLEFLYEYDSNLTSSQRLEILEIATAETERLGRVVTNMLDFSKLKNDFSQKSQIFSGSQILTHILKSNSVVAFNKRILLCNKIDTRRLDLPLVGSYDIVAQILTNFVTNALKFTYPYGTILLRIRVLRCIDLTHYWGKTIVRFSVLDSGIGIPQSETDVIFSQFSRAKKAPSSLVGTGLGLSLVRELLNVLDSNLCMSTYSKKGCHVGFDLLVSDSYDRSDIS